MTKEAYVLFQQANMTNQTHLDKHTRSLAQTCKWSGHGTNKLALRKATDTEADMANIITWRSQRQ